MAGDRKRGGLDRLLSPTARVSDSVGLWQVPRICISNEFPDAADTAGPGTTFLERLDHRLVVLEACASFPTRL